MQSVNVLLAPPSYCNYTCPLHKEAQAIVFMYVMDISLCAYVHVSKYMLVGHLVRH